MGHSATLLLASLATAGGTKPPFDPEAAYTYYKFASAAYCPAREDWDCEPCRMTNHSLMVPNDMLWLVNTKVVRAHTFPHSAAHFVA